MKRTLVACAVLLALAWSLLPYLWLVVTSFTPAAELGRVPPFLPSAPTLDAYRAVFQERPFLRILGNSALVAGVSTALCLALGGLAAFALARLPVRRKALVLGLLLSISLLPPIATVSPIYLALKALGLRDTHAGLVLPYTALGLPLVVWFLTGFLRELPLELYRSARVDGCTPLQAFRRVLLPLIAPGVATTAILQFVLAWNEFLFALALTATPRARTVPVEIALFAGLHELPFAEIAAASVVSTLPLVALVVVLQRWILAGLAAGATKG